MFSTKPESIECAYPVIRETIPQSKLGYSTNNIYDGYPPLMSDGRTITASYQPNAVLNDKIIQENNITSNWQYRKYLTDNGTQIMKQDFREASNDVGYVKRFNDFSSDSMPYLYKSYNDDTKPFGYQNSDLKELYLSREQLDSARIAPTIDGNLIYTHKK
jgi:hypothetical protein